MSKKIVCVITEMPEDKFWLPISIKSYIDWADAVVIVDGSEGKSAQLLKTIFSEAELSKIVMIASSYPHDDKGADGKQRNKYLEHLKEYFNGDLAIVVDSDEVLCDDAKEHFSIIDEFMLKNSLDVYNPRMEHFIDNFSKVDSTHLLHICPGRVFRISKDLKYTEVEHVSLISTTDRGLVGAKAVLESPTLYYHYGYTRGRETIIRKYNNNLVKSNIHTKEFLDWWKNSHLLGTYPVRTFLGQHPKPVREVFKL